MPIYEYECRQCGMGILRFEDRKMLMPICCHKPMVQVVSLPGNPIFKGSGFYQTDYRSDSYVKSAKKETTSEPKKTESKEAAPKPANTARDKKPSRSQAKS